ncbi:MAG: hypothetical protein JSU03_06105 [Bacteroidetes bacterium]|nr:hypothetical protein [Bacteroidota bacterium]
MKNNEAFQKLILIISVVCLILSYIVTEYRIILKIGFYFFMDVILFINFIKLYPFLNLPLKIIWAIFILGVLSVIISLIYFPNYDIKDIATFSILLFAISYNKVYKKHRVEIENL